MQGEREGIWPIGSERDFIAARQVVRGLATSLGFGVTDTTRIVTAVSELARNVHLYAGSGEMNWRIVDHDGRVGLELTFRDRGPGIADVDEALVPGYTTSRGLGLGLPGARRLMDDFELTSSPGEGTVVTVRKWRIS